MKLEKIHHVAIIASDYEASRRFYTEVLGLPVIRENYRPERGDYKVDLKLGDCELELFCVSGAPERPSYPEARGLRHLAFQVEEIETYHDPEQGALRAWRWSRCGSTRLPGRR